MVTVATLRKRTDFVFLKEHGLRVSTQGFVVQYAVQEGECGVCVGYTASTKGVGNAVKRNRAKRRLRACFDKVVRLNPNAELPEGLWLNFVARRAVLEIDFKYLEKDMGKAMAEVREKA